jgi:hypothetical protein
VTKRMLSGFNFSAKKFYWKPVLGSSRNQPANTLDFFGS